MTPNVYKFKFPMKTNENGNIGKININYTIIITKKKWVGNR